MNHRVLVTGTSSGIGLSTARLLAESGCRVAGTLRDPARPPSPTEPGMHFIPMDVRAEDSVAAGVEAALDWLGGIDVLVANAGVSHLGPFEQTEPHVAREVIDTNLFGVAAVCRHVVPVMRRQRGGLLVLVGSMGGRIGIPFQSWYVASKWAVAGFGESLRMELYPFGVRVAVVEPGDIRTAIGRNRRRVAAVDPDYRPFFDRVRARVEATETAEGPEVVAHRILKLIDTRQPGSRCAVGKGMAAFGLLLKLAPAALRDRLLFHHYGIQRRTETRHG